jgi:hypothetical protein
MSLGPSRGQILQSEAFESPSLLSSALPPLIASIFQKSWMDDWTRFFTWGSTSSWVGDAGRKTVAAVQTSCEVFQSLPILQERRRVERWRHKPEPMEGGGGIDHRELSQSASSDSFSRIGLQRLQRERILLSEVGLYKRLCELEVLLGYIGHDSACQRFLKYQFGENSHSTSS